MADPSILVVDDNPDHRELTVMALSECCSPDEIATAPDGVEALDYLFARTLRKLPRLVVLDLKLNRVHGLEALRAVRAHPRTRNLPVVILSSSDVKSDIDACYASGANGYVRKSTDFDELTRKLAQVHGFWMNANERFRNSVA